MLKNMANLFVAYRAREKSTPRLMMVKATFCALLLLFSVSACSQSHRTAEVEWVIDGDTLQLQGGERIRLLGINAPEQEREDQPAEPFSLEAKLALQEWLQGKKIKIYEGVESRDRYNRTLAYVETIEGDDIQLDLISRGYAYAIAIPPNIERSEQYFAAEDRARQGKLGLFSDSDSQILNLSQSRRWQSGFVFGEGYVEEVFDTQKFVNLRLSKNFLIKISVKNWQQYWPGIQSSQFLGKKVQVRGWVSVKNQSARIFIGHPLMMKIQ